MDRPPSVFISYSHRDTEWKDRFVRHLNVSVKQGHFVEWNDEQIGAGEDWYEKISAAMDAASVGVFLISADFLSSDFILREEVPRLIKRRESEGLQIVPVYVRKCDWQAVDWLKPMQMRPSGDRWVVRGEDHLVNDEFADIAKEIRLLLQDVERPAPDGAAKAGLIKAPDLSRLPRAGEHLFGRERELALLDGAWADEQTNVISLIAWGGIGKSALVRRWLGRMARDNYRGARLVYGWSFYKQSLREEEASADEFLADALRWFGEPNPEAFQQIERARRLAELIQRERTLLVLDGVEPLQYSAESGPEGQIKDQTLAELVRLLVWYNPGLLVITSRYVVDDIRGQRATTAPIIELGQLSAEAGGQLLGALGVDGEPEELETASSEYGGHSLALNLLGTYLRDILGGDVRRRNEVNLLEEDTEYGGHARRIMRSYERQFTGLPELAVLHLIGLFDRPAGKDVLRVLRRRPVIEGLNEQLIEQTDHHWKRALARLQRAGLLTDASRDGIDAHPLVREYFGERLRTERPEAWRAGHGRLYEHLRDSAKPLPETLAQMAPLFQAMHHGCQAGRHQEAFEEVYRPRVNRRDEFYNTKKLGAFGAELAALAAFFEMPWDQPVPALAESTQAFILHGAAVDLRALGRLREALAPMRAGMERTTTQEDWTNAAIDSGNLSELHLTMGDIAEAITLGEASVRYADRSAYWVQRVATRAKWADSFHQAGEMVRAHKLLHDAETLHSVNQPSYPRLYSLNGYRYCDFLLDLGRAAEVRNRAKELFRWRVPSDPALDIGLDHLSLGRAALTLGDHAEAGTQLEQAVDGLRHAAQVHHLPAGLLARAALLRETSEFAAARQDLEEVMRIARRSEMRLFQCDAHLEYARLALAENEEEPGRRHLAEAKRLIEETGYGRRRPELTELEAKFSSATATGSASDSR